MNPPPLPLVFLILLIVGLTAYDHAKKDQLARSARPPVITNLVILNGVIVCTNCPGFQVQEGAR